MEREYTIQEILDIFLKKLWLIILLAVAGFIIGFSVSKFLITPQYSSSILMYVSNSNSIENTINNSDLSASQQLVNTYIVILQDDTVMKQIVVSLNEDYSIEEIERLFNISTTHTKDSNENTVGVLGASIGYSGDYSDTITTLSNCIKSSLTMSAKDNTEILNITATTPSAQLSADICNTISEVAPEVLIRVTNAGSVQTIGTAEPATSPSSPNVAKNSAIGFCIGFIIAVVIAFLLDLLDTTLKSANILTENFGLVNLGQIADISSNKDKKDLKNDIRKTHTILDNNIPFYFVEAFKLIRTNIMFSMSTTNNNILAICSSGAGEGKSVVSTNIAISLAQTGKKILIVDCDLRKPVQHKMFKLKNKVGISQYIGKMATLDDIIQHDVVENLDVITSGIIPPNPSEMLASENMKLFLKEVSKLYDYVILDTPPVTVVSDVIGLSNEVAGLVFVVRYQHTNHNDVSKAIESFKVANMNILGFVLNGDNSMYGYGKYSKYGKYGKYYKSYEYRQKDDDNNK